MPKFLSYIFFAVVALIAAPQLSAQGYIPPLEQCEPLYTVQKRNCELEHVYRCDTVEGVFWRKENWEHDDPSIFTDVLTENGDNVGAWDEVDGPVFNGTPKIIDNVDFPKALRQGHDEFELEVSLYLPISDFPFPSVLKGDIVRNGEAVVVDGVTLDPLRQNIEMTINMIDITGYEDVYLDRETGAIIFGENLANFDGLEVMREGGLPAQIIKPGEPGFLENKGRFDCGALS